jgi:tRNA threonylcarbamoyladenosine biosynthesis protein TsaB
VILALDTSSAGGSAAVIHADGQKTLAIETAGDSAHPHGKRLPLDLMAVLRDAGATIDDVDRLAVAVGPGSFTGIRVGIATMQGLALARNLLVTPVSTFEALAWHREKTDQPVATWVDAHRGEVFATLYAPDGRTVLAPATSLQPDATLEAWRETLAPFARVQFLGDGAVRYRGIIEQRLGARAGLDPADHLVAPLLALAIAWIAAEEPDRAVRPHAVVPLYVRRPDVELTRDRREAASKG